MIRKGDRPVVPAAALQISANPLKTNGHLTRAGLDWFAELVFGIEIGGREGFANFNETLEKLQESVEDGFINIPSLSDIDFNDPDQTDTALKRLNENPKSLEWWKFLCSSLYYEARNAIAEGDAARAAWASISAERFRSLTIFKENFEEVVFMGHSAGRLIKLIRIWDGNRQNDKEGFWQKILEENSYAFSQLFSAPVTFIQGGAYVGGTKIDGSQGRLLDFMLAGGSSNHALLVEIKTPKTRLLSAQYRRNVYPPSRDLSGAVVQINDYCDTLRKNVGALSRDSGIKINAFNPRRIILAGNFEEELDNEAKRSSFELFRSSLSGVEILTFDEFFKKLDQLAKLFNLVRG